MTVRRTRRARRQTRPTRRKRTFGRRRMGGGDGNKPDPDQQQTTKDTSAQQNTEVTDVKTDDHKMEVTAEDAPAVETQDKPSSSDKSSPTKCSSGMSFADCELLLMRATKERLEVAQLMKAAQDPEVSKIMSIIEEFLRTNPTLGYGGTAINNILPVEAQFYDKEIDVPDYDFFAKGAQKMAVQIADMYVAKGYTSVEAKSGVHHGTYKVFVNYIPVADITDLPAHVFDNLYKDSVVVDGIHYVPPAYLRMSMYLELSRPHGDVSRWEKVLDRLNRLNEHFPLTAGNMNCDEEPLQQPLDDPALESRKTELVNVLRDTFVRQNVVFFGGFASSIYAEHMPIRVRKKLVEPQPDFDVLAVGAKERADEVVAELVRKGFSDAKVEAHDAVGELVPKHFEICVGETDTVAVLFEPIACHSYNVVNYKPTNQKVNIATIDTMLSFYLAFIYASDELNDRRMPCMSKFLYDVEQRNRMEETGELKRFSMQCVGHQPTLAEMRNKKAEKRLALNRNDPEWNEWFLDYRPKPIKPNPDKEKEEEAEANNNQQDESSEKHRNPLSRMMAYFNRG